jgi:riboflavin transporter FmnP
MALFIALGTVLAFIAIPIWPLAATWGITYDPANVPTMIGGLAFGPGAGMVIGVLSAAIHCIFTTDFVGACMNVVAVFGFVVPAAGIYRKERTTSRLILGLIVGCITSVLLIIPANLIVWPVFYGLPLATSLTYVVPLMIPFNLLKAGLNSVLSLALYKSLHRLIED